MVQADSRERGTHQLEQGGGTEPSLANLNLGPADSGCDGTGNVLFGHDDWGNVLYRVSAAINFAGGETSPEMTKDDEEAFYKAAGHRPEWRRR